MGQTPFVVAGAAQAAALDLQRLWGHSLRTAQHRQGEGQCHFQRGDSPDASALLRKWAFCEVACRFGSIPLQCGNFNELLRVIAYRGETEYLSGNALSLQQAKQSSSQ
jgi:hypothetical protein